MDELITRMMFERESEMRVKKMTKIGRDLWRIETEEGPTFEVKTYTGPLSED